MTSRTRQTLTAEEMDRASAILGQPEPSGSLQPIDEARFPLDAAGIEKVKEIEADITKLAEDAVKSHMRYIIKIGVRLNEARSHFPGDNEFGKWRTEFIKNTALHGTAPRTLNSYMHIGREFKDAPAAIEGIGWTVAREMVGAPQTVMNKVYELLEAGEPVKREDVKNLKEEASRPPGAGKGSPTGARPPTGPPTPKATGPKVLTFDERYGEILECGVGKRIERVVTNGELNDSDELTQCCAIMGVWPSYADAPPHPAVHLAIYDEHRASLEEFGGDVSVLDQAYSTLKEGWK